MEVFKTKFVMAFVRMPDAVFEIMQMPGCLPFEVGFYRTEIEAFRAFMRKDKDPRRKNVRIAKLWSEVFTDKVNSTKPFDAVMYTGIVHEIDFLYEDQCEVFNERAAFVVEEASERIADYLPTVVGTGAYPDAAWTSVAISKKLKKTLGGVIDCSEPFKSIMTQCTRDHKAAMFPE